MLSCAVMEFENLVCLRVLIMDLHLVSPFFSTYRRFRNFVSAPQPHMVELDVVGMVGWWRVWVTEDRPLGFVEILLYLFLKDLEFYRREDCGMLAAIGVPVPVISGSIQRPNLGFGLGWICGLLGVVGWAPSFCSVGPI